MFMTKFVSVYQAKTQLPDLVERAAAGEEIVISKNGVPFAKLVPLPNRAVSPESAKVLRIGDHPAGKRGRGPRAVRRAGGDT